MPMNTAKNHFPIGVDLGEAGLRIAQLRDTGGQLAVYRGVSWDHAAVTANAAGAKADAARIAHLMAQYGFTGTRAVTGMNMPVLEHHLLELPAKTYDLAPAEVNRAARFEINRLTGNNTDLQVGTWALPRSKRSKSTFMGVATTREQVCARVDTLEEAGLECVKVDVVACALASFINHLRGNSRDDVWGVMDIGYDRTRVVVCIQDIPVLVRGLEMGGQSWTERVAERLGLSRSSAERYKRDFGLSGESLARTRLQNEDTALADLATDVLKDDLEELCAETERSYEYVLQCHPGMSPGVLLLIGGGARVGGLADELAGRLGIDVKTLSMLDTQATRLIQEGLGDNETLEVMAQACALSFQGTVNAQH